MRSGRSWRGLLRRLVGLSERPVTRVTAEHGETVADRRPHDAFDAEFVRQTDADEQGETRTD